MCVQAPQATHHERVEAALAALESGYEWLQRRAWPLPYPDGGAGDSMDLDVYLDPPAAPKAAAQAEQVLSWTPMDAATVYAVLDVSARGRELEGCALATLLEAALLAHDPAESQPARAATAAFAAWLATGELGCGDSRGEAQAAAAEGPVGASQPRVTMLALWLAHICQRHDGGSGRFLRDVWEVARQHSRSSTALRARPDFWQALQAALQAGGESLDQAAEAFAVARWFWPSRSESALPSLPDGARVPVAARIAIRELPKHLSGHAQLGHYGSAYVLVETRGAAPALGLRAWLQPEEAGRFALTAIRLDAHGADRGRVSAPAREATDAFVPVELTPETDSVLFVVTRLPAPAASPDPDAPPLGYRLIFDTRGAR